jgi:hypothetical protein
MDKRELETRYQHNYPGYRKVQKLNDKFRDVELNPKKSTIPTDKSFRTMGRPNFSESKPVRAWDIGEGTLGPRWTQKHWETDRKRRSDFQQSEQFGETESEYLGGGNGYGKNSVRLAGKNLRTKNIDGRMK